MQLGDEDTVPAFRVAATRFADIRRAIAEELDAAMRTREGEERREMLRGNYYASPAVTILALSALQPIFLFDRKTCRGEE
jgi:hypothetical protein